MKKTFLISLMIVLTSGIFAQKNGYEKSIEVGSSFGVGDYLNNSFNFAMINGYRFNDHIFVGLGVGLGYSNFLHGVGIDHGITTEYRTEAYLVPIYASLKTNLSKGKFSHF